MPDTPGQRRCPIAAALVTSVGLMIASAALNVAWAAPDTYVIRPPLPATMTTPPGIPSAARSGMPTPPSAASKEETKPVAIDSARQLKDHRLAMVIDRNN